MEADEIIRRKDWYELTAEEREIIKEIASTPQEFNLVKRMLLVSAEQAGEVPSVPPHVKDQIQIHSAKVTQKKSGWYLYAAAAVLIVIVASIFILRKEPVTDPVVRKPDNIGIDKPPVNNTNTSSERTVPVITENKPPVKESPENEKPDEYVPEAGEPMYANVRIGEEEDLLDLITEAY